MRMMKRLVVIAMAIASVTVPGIAHAENDVIGGPALKNGVSLHGPVTWGRRNADRTEYLDPVYDGAMYAVPHDLLKKVKAAGFDFIRLSIDPGPLMALEGEKRDQLDKYVMAVIGEVRNAGLDVVVDFHPISMIKPYGRTAIMIDKPDSIYPKYVEMVGRYSRMLAAAGLVNHVAIEPMNEPAIGNEPAAQQRWQKMMDELYDAAKTGSKDMVVVVTGGSGGSLDALCMLNPSHYDKTTRYSMHYYLPYCLTHAGVSSTSPFGPFYSELPYPAKASDFDAFWAKVEERLRKANNIRPEDVAKGRKTLERYFQKEANREFIAANFDKVMQWAAKYNIKPGQIFMGEFGVTQLKGPHKKGIMPEDRARWLRDVREEADKRGFHWAMWALSGESAWGMTLVDSSCPAELDTLTVQALGKSLPGK